MRQLSILIAALLLGGCAAFDPALTWFGPWGAPRVPLPEEEAVIAAALRNLVPSARTPTLLARYSGGQGCDASQDRLDLLNVDLPEAFVIDGTIGLANVEGSCRVPRDLVTVA